MIERKPLLPGIWLALVMNLSRSWLFWIFWLNLIVYIYKGICLPYAGRYFDLEITFYVVWGCTTAFRSSVGRHGLSRCEPVGLILFAVITLFTILACNLYFIRYQAYILRIELIFNSFCMALEILELILAIVCALLYMKAQAL
jgi:transmembrane protein 216